MRRIAILVALWAVVLGGSLGGSLAAGYVTGANIRDPAVADRFYPGSAAQLHGAVEAFLAAAVPPAGGRPVSLVAPHAGYVFSGQIAADAYRQAQPYEYDVVVILGTCHTVAGFSGMSVYRGQGYRTPLGVAPIDTAVVDALLAADAGITFSPQVHAAEHSVEVQVPFVQVVFPDAKIVGAVVGTSDPGRTHRLGQALAAVLRGRRALIVASSDLSHYPGAEDARRVDTAVLTAVASMRPEAVAAVIRAQMQQAVPGLSTCACGEGAMLCAMAAARELGATHGAVISYAHSGETVFGETGRVVGYGAVAFTETAGGTAGGGAPVLPVGQTAGAAAEQGGAPDSLAQSDRDHLLHLARSTVTQYLRTGTVPLPRSAAPALRQARGVFVTFNKHGALRGCLGHMVEDTPLQLATARMALQAALRDPRFRPIAAAELPDVEVEISVLTPFSRIGGPEEFVVGRDGVLLEKSGQRAVYLPQVATAQGWTHSETLAHLCEKAGLASDCWQGGAALSTFQAEVFAEPPLR